MVEGIELIIIRGDDGKIWLTEPHKAEELRIQWFEILWDLFFIREESVLGKPVDGKPGKGLL